MKNIHHILLFLILSIISSCTDVINVDLEPAPPRLVIEARILWELGTAGTEQLIKLTTTTDFFGTTIPTVSNAIVYIENNSGTTFNFIESQEMKGNYKCSNFEPVLGESYHLTVIHKSEIYKATETMTSVVPFEYTTQLNNKGFTGDHVQVTAFFQDPADEENFYLIQRSSRHEKIDSYGVRDDRFQNGNVMSAVYIHKNLVKGDLVAFTLHGISRQYYNYLNILLSSTGGNVFNPPPGVVRGNIVNTTDSDNFALGYFNLSQVSKITHIVE